MSATNLPPDSESTAAPPAVTPLQFSLRTLLILVTIIASIAGFFRWRYIQRPEIQQAILLAKFSQRFDSVPLDVGNWEGAELTVYRRHIDAGTVGAIKREYRNRNTGTTIELSIIRGPGRSTYTPIPHAGYNIEAIGEVRFRDYDLGKQVRSIATWELVDIVDGKHFYELLTYSSVGLWAQSESPRIEFWQEPELTQIHMLYSAKTTAQLSWPEFDAFVVEIFPHLQENLFPSDKSRTLVDRPWLRAIAQIPWVELFFMVCSVFGLIYLGRRRRSIPDAGEPNSQPESEDLPLPSEF